MVLHTIFWCTRWYGLASLELSGVVYHLKPSRISTVSNDDAMQLGLPLYLKTKRQPTEYLQSG